MPQLRNNFIEESTSEIRRKLLPPRSTAMPTAEPTTAMPSNAPTSIPTLSPTVPPTTALPTAAPSDESASYYAGNNDDVTVSIPTE